MFVLATVTAIAGLLLYGPIINQALRPLHPGHGQQKAYSVRVKPFGFLQHVPLAPGLQQAMSDSITRYNLVAPNAAGFKETYLARI